MGTGPRPLCSGSLHFANITSHRFRCCRPAHDRESLAQYRAAAAMARMAAVSCCRRPFRLRAVSFLRCVYHPRPCRPRSRPGTCARCGIHGPVTRAGDGSQPTMAGRYSCIPPGRVAHRDLGCERLFPPRGGNRRLAVARIRWRLGTGAAACDALRQRCRPRDGALLREHP